jgi:hypothetical protein
MMGALKSAAAAAAAFFSAREILSFATSSVQAFMEAEKASNGLQSALEILGKASELAEMKVFAADIQRVTTAEDDAVIAMMKLGASIGGMSGDTLKQATVAAIGLSKAYGMDMESAMTLVSKAAQGATGAFSRYGIVFKDGMTDAEKFNQILEIGRQKFGMAEAETATFSGKLAQLSNAWGNAKESLGEYLAESSVLMGAMNFANTVMNNFGLSMDILVQGLALGFVSLWEDIKYNTYVGIEYIKYFADNWKEIFVDLWNGTKAVLSNLWENFKNFFLAVTSWIKGDGFNFEWTGLLDGFKSTMKEMKPIAERQMSDLEQALTDELAKNMIRWDDAGKSQKDKTLDTSQLGPAQLSLAAAGAGQSKAGVAAVESRFLLGQTAGQDYNRQTAENSRSMKQLLQELVREVKTAKQTAHLPGQPALLAAGLY